MDYSRALPGSKLVTDPTAKAERLRGRAGTDAEWKAMNAVVNHQEESSPQPYQLRHCSPGPESTPAISSGLEVTLYCTDNVALGISAARVRLSVPGPTLGI